MGKEYKVAIDSGASVNMLTETYFSGLEAELSQPFSSTLSGADNRVQAVKGGTIKRVMVDGQLPLVNMITVFTTIAPLAKSQPTPIDGILGYEFLRQYQVTINYPKGEIELR